MLSAIGFVLFVVALGMLVEAVQAHFRRGRVEEYLLSRGWTLKSCRYRPKFSPHWAVPYRVEVVDATGHELSGTAWARHRKVWVDW